MNESARTRGSSTIAFPTSPPDPYTRFSTPGGSPASANIETTIPAVSGVSDAGLKTTAFPATSAGAIFQHGIATGKFQGVIAPTTPIGSRTV